MDIAAKLAVINVFQDAAPVATNGILTINTTIALSNTVLIPVSAVCYIPTIRVAGNLVPDPAWVKKIDGDLRDSK